MAATTEVKEKASTKSATGARRVSVVKKKAVISPANGPSVQIIKSASPAKRQLQKLVGAADFHKWQGAFVRQSPNVRIEAIRHGFEARMLVSASEYFNMPRIAFGTLLGMSASTMERKIKQHALLGTAESERLARIAMIEAEAEELFGDKQIARDWLLSKNLVLGDTPMSMLDTEVGANEVRKIMYSIAYGGAV